MATRVMRNIVRIDESRCDGCGLCVTACAEGALQIIEGKAKLVSETYCDGLGACLGGCPQGAITIEAREVEDFDKTAVEHNLAMNNQKESYHSCPSATVIDFDRAQIPLNVQTEAPAVSSRLNHWPIQLALIPPSAPFLQGAELLLVADCVPFAYADFHRNLLDGHAVAIACPKLDDAQAHIVKLSDILRFADVRSITVLRMEVPCCGGLTHIARQALRISGKDIPLNEVITSIKGELRG